MLTTEPGLAVPMFEDVPSVEAFPEDTTEFLHNLHQDPRMEVEALADLADRLQKSVVHEAAVKPLLSPRRDPHGACSSVPETRYGIWPMPIYG